MRFGGCLPGQGRHHSHGAKRALRALLGLLGVLGLLGALRVHPRRIRALGGRSGRQIQRNTRSSPSRLNIASKHVQCEMAQKEWMLSLSCLLLGLLRPVRRVWPRAGKTPAAKCRHASPVLLLNGHGNPSTTFATVSCRRPVCDGFGFQSGRIPTHCDHGGRFEHRPGLKILQRPFPLRPVPRHSMRLLYLNFVQGQRRAATSSQERI